MANSGEIDTELNGLPIGMSPDRTLQSIDNMDGAPRKHRRMGNKNASGFQKVILGINGYVYTVKYTAGKIVLRGDTGPGGDNRWGLGDLYSISTSDWMRIRLAISRDLGIHSFCDTPHVSVWASDIGPEAYRVEAGCPTCNPRSFIYISVCKNRAPIIAKETFGFSPNEHASFFENLFFIQWEDWCNMRRVFREFDHIVKRDRACHSVERVRKCLFFDNSTNATQNVHMCDKENTNHERLVGSVSGCIYVQYVCKHCGKDKILLFYRKNLQMAQHGVNPGSDLADITYCSYHRHR